MQHQLVQNRIFNVQNSIFRAQCPALNMECRTPNSELDIWSLLSRTQESGLDIRYMGMELDSQNSSIKTQYWELSCRTPYLEHVCHDLILISGTWGSGLDIWNLIARQGLQDSIFGI
jgi:hypothetical protein